MPLEQADSPTVDTMTAVLPLRIAGARNSDLDRVQRLLLPSFELYWRRPDQLEIMIIVPPADLRRISTRLAGTTSFPVRILPEDALCPSLRGKSGWYKQQILKLAAAEAVPGDWYLTLDADVILRRPTVLHDLFVEAKPMFKQEAAWHHWDWWRASSVILGTTIAFDRDTRVMGATPEILNRDIVIDLLAEIRRRNRTDRADRFLFEAQGRGWTEYSLYWLYVLERGLENELYSWSHPSFYEGIWVAEQLTDRNYVEHLFSPACDAFFLVLQSNLGLPLRELEQLIQPYIPLAPDGSSRMDLIRDWVARQMMRASRAFR